MNSWRIELSGIQPSWAQLLPFQPNSAVTLTKRDENTRFCKELEQDHSNENFRSQLQPETLSHTRSRVAGSPMLLSNTNQSYRSHPLDYNLKLSNKNPQEIELLIQETVICLLGQYKLGTWPLFTALCLL